MLYLIELGIKNALKSKVMLISASLILCFGLSIFGFTLAVADQLASSVSQLEDSLQAKSSITVVGNNHALIPLSVERRIASLDGINSLCRDHYFNCLFCNEFENQPLQIFHLLEFDFDKQMLDDTNDYRNTNASGIVIPELFEDFSGKEISASLAFTDKEVYISFDYMNGDDLETYTHSYPVIGYYQAEKRDDGAYLAYLSKDIYADFLSLSKTPPEAKSLIIYPAPSLTTTELIQEIENMGFSAYSNDASAESYLSFVKSVRSAGVVIGLVLMVLSTIIVLQSLTASVRKREKTIGLMKAFGYQDHRIMVMLIVEVLIYGLLALLLSVLLSSFMAKPISKALNSIFPDASYTLSIEQMGIEILSLLVISFLALMKPWYRCSKLSPLAVLKSANS